MKATDLVLLVAAGGLAVAAFVYWKRSAPTTPTAAPVPGPGGGHAVPATTVIGTAAVFSPSTSGGMAGGRSGEWLRQLAAQGG